MINSAERGFGLGQFTHAERWRRWCRVRTLMRQEKLDAIVGFPNQSHWDQFQADIRYLTHIGGHQTEVATVFPLEGEVTAFVRGGNEVEWWSVAQNWVTDLRPTRRSWGEPVIERLRELKLDHSRIGVSGLSGLLRAPEGTVVSGMLEKLKAAFPGARFENATELLQDARSVKGPEEVAWIERAAEILDKVVVTILAKAKPGVMENEMVAVDLANYHRQRRRLPVDDPLGRRCRGSLGLPHRPSSAAASRRYDQHRDRSQIWRLYRTDRPGSLLGKNSAGIEASFRGECKGIR